MTTREFRYRRKVLSVKISDLVDLEKEYTNLYHFSPKFRLDEYTTRNVLEHFQPHNEDNKVIAFYITAANHKVNEQLKDQEQ